MGNVIFIYAQKKLIGDYIMLAIISLKVKAIKDLKGIFPTIFFQKNRSLYQLLFEVHIKI